MASKEAWRNRIVGHGDEEPTQLLANPKNWRIHPGTQQQALAGALDQVGWVQQVIVNQTTGHMVDGHLRVELAISRGEPSVPVVYVDLTAEEEALVLASLDPIGAMAATDDEKLRMLMAEVAFDSQALEDAIAKVAGESTKREGLTDADDVPEPSEAPWVKPGDLFALGDHRLLCGDATNADDVARLLDGASVDAVVTDPPYGLDRNLARAKGRAWRIANDDASAEAMYAALLPFADVPERYVWGQWNTWGNLVGALGEPDNCIVWVKSNMGMGHGYRHQHEFCAYYGAKSFTDQSDVWESPRDYSGLHPTMKPVALIARAIENSTGGGGTVLDLFAGSGTILVAAEQTGRRALAMELDPKYVQVSIERWEAFTGRKAEPLQ